MFIFCYVCEGSKWLGTHFSLYKISVSDVQVTFAQVFLINVVVKNPPIHLSDIIKVRVYLILW